MLVQGPVRAADLWSVYELAQLNDPTYRAARFNFEAEEQRVPQARSQLLPFLDGGLSRNRRYEDLTSDADFTTEGSVNFTQEGYDIAFIQPLFDKPAWESLKQARVSVQRAAVELQFAWEDLALRVADRYFNVLAARDNLDVVLGTKRSFKRQLELASERLNVGLGTQTDLFLAEARFQLAEAEEIEAHNLIQDALRGLAELTGEYITDLDEISPSAQARPPEPAQVDPWVEAAMASNSSIRSQELTVDVADREIDIRRSERYPLIDLNVNQNFNDADGSLSGPGSEFESRDVLLRLRVPFYSGGLISSRTREAASLYGVASGDLEATRRRIEREVRSKFLDVSSFLKRIEALEQAVVAQESAVQGKEEGFAAGLNTNRDVLDTQTELFQAQRDLLQARYNYILDVLDLEQLTGNLDTEDLRRVNSWLQ